MGNITGATFAVQDLDRHDPNLSGALDHGGIPIHNVIWVGLDHLLGQVGEVGDLAGLKDGFL